MKTKRLLNPVLDFWALFYPKLCMACNGNMRRGKDVICLFCKRKLPKTDYHLVAENPMAEHFWGRVPIHHAAAYYYFSKGTKVQNLVHQLKYGNRPWVGECLGKWYGTDLMESEYLCDVEVIVPVPLHKKRRRLRGYNQSEVFAKGLAYSMKKPLVNALKRNMHTTTQTKKSRLERFANVETAFEIVDLEAVHGKHVLLVDDVVTTGATLEACAAKLLECEGTSVSLATIAIAGGF